MRRLLVAALCLLLIALPPKNAEADCTGPSRAAGSMVYNKDYHVMQYCDGTSWLALGAIAPSAGSSCSGPSGNPGDIIFNNDYKILQYCNGTNWMAMGGTVSNSTCPGGSGRWATRWWRSWP